MSAGARFTAAAFCAAFLVEGYLLGSRGAPRTAAPAAVEVPPAAAGITSELIRTDREITVAIRVPGLRADSLTVAVDGALVTIVCLAERPDFTRRYEMIMPLPPSADAARHRVVQEADAIKIIFQTAPGAPMAF